MSIRHTVGGLGSVPLRVSVSRWGHQHQMFYACSSVSRPTAWVIQFAGRDSIGWNGWLQRVSPRRFLVGGVACARSWGSLGIGLSYGASSRVSYPKEPCLASPWSVFRLCFPNVPAFQAAVRELHPSRLVPLPASMLPFAPSTTLGPHPVAPSPARSHHDRAHIA